MKKHIIKVLSLIFALIIVASVLLLPASAVKAPYYNPADDTYVVNDIKKFGYNPEHFPKDPSADFVQVIHFLEYGYNADGDQGFYSLYLYLYNPSGRAMDVEGSYLELAYKDYNSDMSKIVKYPLTVEGRSKDTFDENVFYKLKVGGTRGFVNSLSSIRREYQLSAIEIKYEDADGVESFPLKATWIYTGYQYNFGSNNPEGTLFYRVDEHDTISVEVIPLSWFSDTSNLGEDYRWEVKSYAFNIPKSYINRYGDPLHVDPENKKYQTSGLVKVSGEYYKYGVNGLIVPDQTWYDKFKDIRNKDLRWTSTTGTLGLSSSYPGFLFGDVPTGTYDPLFEPWVYYSSFNYNVGQTYEDYQANRVVYSKTKLYNFALLSQGTTPDISQKDFEDLWKSSGEPFFTNNAYMPMIGDYVYNFSYNSYDISVDDANLNSALITHAAGTKDGINKWLDKLFHRELYTDEGGYLECKPIVQINDFDIDTDIKTPESIGKALFISNDNITDLRSFYSDNKSSSNVYIIRTGVEPYYCVEADLSNSPYVWPGAGTAYYYEKVIHTDFDILSFTFRRYDGKIQTVPVDCKPVDNLGSVVGGNNQDDNNPNNYPDTPSGLGGIIDEIKNGFKWGSKVLEWLDQFKTVFLLLMGLIGSVTIFVLVCIFWKWLQPIFQRIGEVLGPVFRGIGKFFGGIFRGIGFIFGLFGKVFYSIFRFIWNVAFGILSTIFPFIPNLQIGPNFGGVSREAPDRYAYEDLKYRQTEEKRKQERHEAEMAALRQKGQKSQKSEEEEMKKELSKNNEK